MRKTAPIFTVGSIIGVAQEAKKKILVERSSVSMERRR
jgi:hypothetical protein